MKSPISNTAAFCLAGALAFAACASSDSTGYGGYSGYGGTGGTGGASGSPSICGCTQATAQDLTAQPAVTVSFGGALGLAYAPSCVTVKQGTVVTFSGDFSVHPLRPGPAVSDPGNPMTDVGPADAGASASFTFATTGSFGYHCLPHGTDETGMCGAVYVVP